MIRRYVFGNPIETEAVLNKPDVSQGQIPWMEKTENGWSCGLKPRDIVYGLGQNVRGINKRG